MDRAAAADQRVPARRELSVHLAAARRAAGGALADAYQRAAADALVERRIPGTGRYSRYRPLYAGDRAAVCHAGSIAGAAAGRGCFAYARAAAWRPAHPSPRHAIATGARVRTSEPVAPERGSHPDRQSSVGV